jgi:2-keto-3-deoxy-L-rhamnonate aldolase RhmA
MNASYNITFFLEGRRMKKLFTAIKASDLEAVRQIIEKKPALVNCVAKQPPKKDDGQSPLQVALKTGNCAIAYYLLDMGADGVMLPRVETVAQLKKAVDGFFFPPIGKKGKGGHGHLRFGEAFGDYAKTRFLMPQIESPEGVKNLPAMLEAYGEYISAVIIGPYDLSITNGTPCDITSEVNLKSIQEVFDTCKRYGKSCGIFCENEACAKRFKEMGANVIWIGSDLDMFMRGYNQFVNEVKTLF